MRLASVVFFCLSIGSVLFGESEFAGLDRSSGDVLFMVFLGLSLFSYIASLPRGASKKQKSIV